LGDKIISILQITHLKSYSSV